MRGEYSKAKALGGYHWELPPHARRIPRAIITKRSVHGTTSACAENTPRSSKCDPAHRNYLRMRGEYIRSTVSVPYSSELPPHARRIRTFLQASVVDFGTTSACAENTIQTLLQGGHTRNYLRMRGEYLTSINLRSTRKELPPHARRIRGLCGGTVHLMGTTSACAENTSLSYNNYVT